MPPSLFNRQNQFAVRALLAIAVGAVDPVVVLAQTAPLPITAMPPTTLPLLKSSSPTSPHSQAARLEAEEATAPIPVGSSYKLGAGDLVRLEMFDVPELTLDPRYTVLFDGTLNLPWIGGVSVQGLTLDQASDLLKTRYKRYIQNPVISMGLIAPRPLKIGVIGAVNRPGSYIITVIGSEITQASLSQRSASESGSQWPTVSRALQTAGGIAQVADVRMIEVRRLQADGTAEKLNVDLWKYLQAGDLTQDILLQDGDTIVVPVATKIDATQATAVANSNFSPEQIQINVVGEVVRPGGVAIRPNSTMMQAILAAGGITPGRGNKTKVELVRLMPDGTTSRREFKFDLSKGLDDASNPAIHQNDVIVVNRSNTAKFSDILGAVVSPITGGFGLLRLLLGR
ncbi:polysaccharide biosynthesis/export family protein [Myxacorys almedinensis]|uniref:Polysaccharide transporter n=1 Tax=Myxacorys almedinensis A TaxID=2690445 RepID=A0A8J7YX06_9CYAN|nr:polysaccharide biosynthesis/export family protein [Myxacorys almedinensis]NDJ16212.1 polysaccharide transporter [Myxacorys almedinensis A]